MTTDYDNILKIKLQHTEQYYVIPTIHFSPNVSLFFYVAKNARLIAYESVLFQHIHTRNNITPTTHIAGTIVDCYTII